MKRCLNILGLVLGVIGAAILFKWGPPQPDLAPYVGRRTSEIDHKAVALLKQHKVVSRIGMAMVVAAFALQLAAEFAPEHW